MPVRIHGRLLAEWAAMLGACLAAAGCQTSWVRNDTTPLAASGDPNPGGSGALLQRWHGDRHVDPAVQTVGHGQVVSMLRPVAVDGDGGAPQTVSGWNTIQRTSAEQGEPPLAPPAQVLATSAPAALTTEAPAHAANDPPEQLTPPTPLPAPQIVDGAVVLPHGPPVPGYAVAAPKEFDKRSYPLYVIEPPDILQIQAAKGLLDQPINFTVPVGMDGYVNLGIYGSVYVAGLTVEAAREVIAAQIGRRVKDFDVRSVSVQVAAYNSKVYYLITDGGGYGATVARFPATGNETVLDALSQIGGLPNVASKKKIWVARATPGHSAPQIMPVDWCGIALRGEGATNYQIFPGDRIYVGADPWVSGDTWIARRLAPIQNVLGTILLGSTTVNSIKGRSTTVP
jgi:protein involved in polysaccharide export with SLBB domain